jgi:hypothetical protein
MHRDHTEILAVALRGWQASLWHTQSLVGVGLESGSGPPRDTWGRRPLYDEVSQDLALDGVVRLEVHQELSELRSPLGDVAYGVRVVEDGPQRKGGHHHNPMCLEIMAQLPGRD